VESPELSRRLIPADAEQRSGSLPNGAYDPTSKLKTTPGLAETLTPRELEVLKLIADGKTTKRIAELLGVSFKTVATHRTSILEKFGVHNSVSLLRCDIRRGIVEP
jgi:DNA-binding NarL/FixJ family response regulator